MIKTFFKHGIIYTISSFLSKGLAILLLPLYVRVLSSADYGLLDMVLLVGLFLNYILTLEIGQGIARFYCELDDGDKQKRMTSTAFYFIFFNYIIFSILVFLFRNSIVVLLNIENLSNDIFNIIVVYFVINALFLFLQNQLRWQLKPKLNMFINLLNLLTIAFAKIVFLLFFKMGIIGVFLGMIVGNLISGIVAFCFVQEIKFVFDFRILKTLLEFSVPLVFSSIAFVLSTSIDRFVIKSLMTMEAVGMYGIAYRLSSPITLVLSGFQGALTPLIYKNYKDENSKNDISSIFNFFSFFALIIFLGLSIFAHELLVIFTVEQYFGVYTVIPYLVLSVLLSNQYVFFPGLGIANKTLLIALINILGAALNTLLNFLLIPRFGIMGAAFATLLSILLTTIIYVQQSQKYYKLSIHWLKLLISFSICILLIWITQYRLTFPSLLLSIFIKLLLFSVTFICIGLLLIRKDIKLIFKKCAITKA